MRCEKFRVNGEVLRVNCEGITDHKTIINMDHKKLDAWKYSMDLVERIYKITSSFPKSEVYGLTSQIRRSAVSVPSNIAEGAARDSNKEYHRFLNISLGSLSELETQLMIAVRLNYINDSDNILVDLINLRKIIIGLKKYIKKSINP